MSDVYDSYNQVLGLSRTATDSEDNEDFRWLFLQYQTDNNEDGTVEFRRVLMDYHKIMRLRDSEAIKSKNASGQLSELGNFPMPPETSPGNYHKELKVAAFIGGVLVGTYVAYRVFHKLLPVPQPNNHPAIPTQETSQLHPGSIWTLFPWLAALKTKRILGLSKLSPGENIRVSPSALNAAFSSAAKVLGKTVIHEPRAVGSSAISGSSLATAANTVAKLLPASVNSATEAVAKTLPQGFLAGLYAASKTVVAKTFTQTLHSSKTAAKSTLNALSVVKTATASWKWIASKMEKRL
ncbi:uncharacterized protein Dyak_GE22994 [Drosophila yakuba]|uniref:Uncharacterized protein n=1 Tax=Drosophila yakuba TaxID=7245 RepID=B4ITB9_DROYA|nr:uncharacterized protein Dyak_GE22994 [Drosophila yakuba]